MTRGVELILVSHGLPGRVEGVTRPDPSLTAAGAAQAQAAAGLLAGLPVREIASSDLRRARETAQPTAERFGLPVTIDPDLAELDLGADFYIPIEEMVAKRDPRLDQWRELTSAVQAGLPTFTTAVGEDHEFP
jgi:probable phosphoglycerate mutase